MAAAWRTLRFRSSLKKEPADMGQNWYAYRTINDSIAEQSAGFPE
jgi:hypothetical protein